MKHVVEHVKLVTYPDLKVFAPHIPMAQIPMANAFLMYVAAAVHADVMMARKTVTKQG
jgi:hypothetical protein